MVGSGSSNPLESNLKFNGARSLSPLSFLGEGGRDPAGAPLLDV